MTKLFQIYADDLQKLEVILPQLQDALMERACEPAIQVKLQEAKEILSNVRWSYGPPVEMHRISCDPPLDGP